MLIQDHAVTAEDLLTASGRAFDETTRFRTAYACEQATEWGEWRLSRSATTRWLPAAATSGAVDMIESIAGQARGRLTIHGVVCPARGRRQFVDRR